MNDNIKKALNYLDKLGINYRYAERRNKTEIMDM